MRKVLLNFFMFLPVIFVLFSDFQLTFSNFIVLFIFISLGYVGSYSLLSNNAIFNFLQKNDLELSNSPENNQLAWDIWRALMNKKGKEHVQLNIPSFIEMYMSEFYIDKAKKINIVKRIKLIHTYSSISILLGVLGTFIGLVVSLASLNTANIDLSIIKLLAGVDTAFYTSIAGILYSILINLHSKYRNSEQLLLQVMLKIENYIYQKDRKTSDYYLVEAIGEVRDAVQNMGKVLLEDSNLTKELKVASENLNHFNNSFYQNVKEVSTLFHDMRTIMDLFNSSSSQIHNDFGRLFDYFDHQTEHHQEIKQSFVKASNDIEGFIDKQSQIVEVILDNSKDIKIGYEDLFKKTQVAIGRAYKEMEGFFHLTSSQFIRIVEQNENQMENQKKFAKAIRKQFKEDHSQLIEEFRELINQNAEEKETIIDTVNKIESYFISNQKLSKIAEDVDQIIKKNSELLTGQTEILIAAIKKYTNENEKIIAPILKMNKTDEALLRGFQDLSTQVKNTNELLVQRDIENQFSYRTLDASLNDLRETLVSFSNNMEESKQLIPLNK